MFLIVVLLFYLTHVVFTTNVTDRVNSIVRRSVINLNGAIQCTTGMDGLTYFSGYGCHCGMLGPAGGEVDGIDSCCVVHDNCYTSVLEDNKCTMYQSYMNDYDWTCHHFDGTVTSYKGIIWRAFKNKFYTQDTDHMLGRPHCSEENDECGQALCQCDLEVAMCFSSNPYQCKKQCPYAPVVDTSALGWMETVKHYLKDWWFACYNYVQSFIVDHC